jgi:hypothetical protein
VVPVFNIAPIDAAFDGAYRQSQSLGDFAAGQSLTDQHHDLAFAIGQRQGLASRRSAKVLAPHCSARAVARVEQPNAGKRT